MSWKFYLIRLDAPKINWSFLIRYENWCCEAENFLLETKFTNLFSFWNVPISHIFFYCRLLFVEMYCIQCINSPEPENYFARWKWWKFRYNKHIWMWSQVCIVAMEIWKLRHERRNEDRNDGFVDVKLFEKFPSSVIPIPHIFCQSDWINNCVKKKKIK